jgi:hypothetical protein
MEWGYIRPSKSFYGLPVLFGPKGQETAHVHRLPHLEQNHH